MIIISTFNESLIYLFPNDKNQIFLQSINFPVQTGILYGTIDFNKPRDEVMLNKIHMKIPFQDALKYYQRERGRIILSESGFYFAGRGGLKFQNCDKMFSLSAKTTIGVWQGTLEVTNSSSLFAELNNDSDSLKWNLHGPLLFSSENTFLWAQEIAANLGTEFGELEIKDLYTKSEFFLLAIAHKKLKPKAEEILQKKSRSEKDTSFQYPLWEFKKDRCELLKAAQQENINLNYVDELLACKALQPNDGQFLWYYANPRGFMWQWFLLNSIILIVLISLRFGKYNRKLIIVHILGKLSPPCGKVSFILLLLAYNGWIFHTKPSSVTLIYWLLPSLVLIASILCWISITAIASSYYEDSKKQRDCGLL